MNTLETASKIASTLLILIPLTFNVMRLRQAGILGRLFLCFLLAGLITDLMMWYLYIHPMPSTNLKVYFMRVYSLGEALFFFWLIRFLAPSQVLKKSSGYCLYGTPVVWTIFLLVPLYGAGKTSQSIPFVTTYEVIAAFLSGFALLSMVEKEERLLSFTGFWLILGIFFYCFCTFFIMTLLGSQLSSNLWPLHNIVNMLTYLFYSIGWILYRKV